VKRPELFRSIRFRLTVIYSLLLFALAGTGLAVTYFAVEQATDPRPVTRKEADLYKRKGSGNLVKVGTIDVGAIDEIESAVNYNTLQNLRRYSFIALGGLFVASLGIGWVLSGQVLRPVGRITRTAREIQATDLSRRIHLDGPHDELRDLAETIDSMLDRLDQAFQAQRQLIDDASHELRSPLAIIRTNLDASLNAPEASPEERERAVAVVDRATNSDVELASIAREAGEEWFITDRNLRLRYELTEDLHLIGDADGLRRAVGNLLSNAVRLAPGSSTVTVATGRTGSWLWIAVADQGPGISAADLPRVFDRFWRGAASAGPERSRERRTGLGLAIVRQIVESHDGHVTAFSELGKGSTFVLWLPAAGRADAEPPPAVSPWP
jgi:signal transduction histidine kinase